MAVGVLPGLEVVTHEYRVEPRVLGFDAKAQQGIGRELFGRSLVSKAQFILPDEYGQF